MDNTPPWDKFLEGKGGTHEVLQLCGRIARPALACTFPLVETISNY